MDDSEVLRQGVPPVVEHFAARGSHDTALVAHLRSVLAMPGVHPGDVAVLATRTRDVSAIVRLLAASALPAMELTKYDGLKANAVKVGTVKRAKGLEFKHVFIAYTLARLISPTNVIASDRDIDDRLDLGRRELYVATTRARDGLWVGVLAA